MTDSKSSSHDRERLTTTNEPVEPEIKEARRNHGDILDHKVSEPGEAKSDKGREG